MITFFIFFLTLIVVFYIYRREKQKYFARLGIKGPTPNFLFGNLNEYRKTLFSTLLQKWAKEYGKIFGYFEGSTPILVISDPDLLQEVMIKQFSNFHGRKLFPLQLNPDKDERVSMFLARGKRWKRMRTTINPAFSEGKMRRMYPMIDQCIQSMISSLEKKFSKGKFGMDIQEPLQRLTMDIICKCAFGVETNCQTNINHPFIVCLKNFLTAQSFSTFKSLFVLTFPELRPLVLKLLSIMTSRPVSNPNLLIVRNKLIEVIEARKKDTEKRNDLLQLLLDAEMPGKSVLDEDNLCPVNNISSLVKEDNGKVDNELDIEEIDETLSSKSAPTKSGKAMTTEEVIAQTNLFLFAGYETSSTALTFTMHFLTEHTDVQKNLQKEIDDAFQGHDYETMSPSEVYDIASKLPYLNAVIFEVLRHHPFASTVITRMCLKSQGTYLSNGLFIPEGMIILPNVYALHFDSDLWSGIDPKKFDPERFIERNGDSCEFIGPPHPLAWIPFGAGPRNCVGQRFAMMVMKSTIVRFFYKFSVSASDKTEYPIKLKMAAVIGPKDGVHLHITKRTPSED